MNPTPPARDELDVIGDRIASTSASIDAAIHQLLTDIRRFDLEQGWGRQGALSCAHWLGWRCGIALGAAREKVRVAHALAALPVIDEALRLGRLSYSKVRAMTRVATAHNERNLVAIAEQSTASQLEKICRLTAQLEPRPDGPRQPARWVHVKTTDDGMVRIELQLAPDEAARVLKACEASTGSQGTRVEGFLAMAEQTLRGDKPDRPPTEILLHIDAQSLAGHGDDCGVSAETSRRLLCDAGVVPVLEDGHGKPIDVGRKTRTIFPALRRALLARDGGCRFPGCSNHRFVDGHHIEHWVDGGETSLDNTVLVCSRHHTMVHEGGFSVVRDGETLRFLDPRGTEVRVEPAEPSALPAVAASTPGWDTGLDYEMAVDCLL